MFENWRLKFLTRLSTLLIGWTDVYIRICYLLCDMLYSIHKKTPLRCSSLVVYCGDDTICFKYLLVMWIYVKLLGYVLPKFTQLTVTSYYASSSASHYGISLLTRHIEENYSSKTRQHLKRLWWFLSGVLTRKIHYLLAILFTLPSCGWFGVLKFHL